MDLDHARAYIRDNHHAVLATTRADGRPQLSPVTCGVDAEGFVVVSTRETAYKAKNLRRDPRASLCVFPDGFFGEWVQVEGTLLVGSGFIGKPMLARLHDQRLGFFFGLAGDLGQFVHRQIGQVVARVDAADDEQPVAEGLVVLHK